MNENEYFFEKNTLNVAGRDLRNLPTSISKKYCLLAKELDLSYNNFQSIESLKSFSCLERLLLDNNNLENNCGDFSNHPKLRILSVNNNVISNLDEFITNVTKGCPKLTFLSMLKNPACPNHLVGKDSDDYRRYRLFVLHKLPHLKFLDSTNVTKEELSEAKRIGSFMKVATPKSTPLSSSAAAAAAASSSSSSSKSKNSEEKSFEGSALDPELEKDGQKSATYGVCQYMYYGKQSEGNRFIMNDDL